jgi:hypothetical protein
MLGLQSFLPLCLTLIIAVSFNTVSAASVPLITSSVKLRVDAPNGHAWGTGTIIDTRQGEALILTCGHIFRESQGKGNIEVHLFGDNSTVRVLGTCLFYDSEGIDLALVAVKPPCPVQAVPIAPASYQIKPSQYVSSVGCDHGGNPTVRSHQVISIDKALPQNSSVPFHFVQVSGAPVSGRSGGGLFCAEGYLIGVCNTGDPVIDDGHFVPAQMIRYVLDKMSLADVYQNPSLGEPQLSPPAAQLATLTPLAPLEPILNTLPTAAPAMPAPMVATNYVDDKGGMSKEEQATLEELKRRKQDGDEVILIVRSRRNPEIPSDVIVLNGTSEQFLEALVNNPPPSSQPNNSVIFSSHESEQTNRQPVSFPVRY